MEALLVRDLQLHPQPVQVGQELAGEFEDAFHVQPFEIPVVQLDLGDRRVGFELLAHQVVLILRQGVLEQVRLGQAFELPFQFRQAAAQAGALFLGLHDLLAVLLVHQRLEQGEVGL